MSIHESALAAVRHRLRARQFAEAIELGRAELASGRESAELLVLIAVAGQLEDGESCTLEEVREWLQTATRLDPTSVDALVEYGCHLDAVADQPELAVPVFEDALERSIGYLEAALEGLESAVEVADERLRARLAELRTRTLEAWELSTKLA